MHVFNILASRAKKTNFRLLHVAYCMYKRRIVTKYIYLSILLKYTF